MTCDHLVALERGPEGDASINASEVITSAQDWARLARHLGTLHYIFKIPPSHFPADPRPIDYYDGRRGYTQRFNYCPLCGTEIDWRSLLAPLRTNP